MKSIIGGIKHIYPSFKHEKITPPDDANAIFAPFDKPVNEYSNEEIYAALNERGVVLPVSEKPKKALMVSFTETDVGISLFSRLALAYPDRIAYGAVIIMKLWSARKCRLCFPRQYVAEANALIDATRDFDFIRTETVANVYPLYDPRALISYLYNVEISPLKALEETAYGVVTPETCVAVYNALVLGLEYRKYFSCDGIISGLFSSVPERKIPAVFDDFDGVIRGGFIRGSAIGPNEKIGATDGFILGETKESKALYPCVHCGKCVMVCPMKLSPETMISCDKMGINVENADRCILCGACDYLCPSGIKITDIIKKYRSENAENKEGEADE